MKKLPLFIDLRGKLVVVVGGGRVAQRKIRVLLHHGAKVRVYEPKPSRDLLSLKGKEIEVITRKVKIDRIDKIVSGAAMVIVATNDADLNRRIGEALKGRGILVNVVSSYELSTAVFPATLELGNVVVAISTSGLSPFLASHIKDKIEKVLGSEIKALSEVMVYVRNNLKNKKLPLEVKKTAYNSIIHDNEVVSLALKGFINDAKKKALKVALKALRNAGFTN